MLSSDNNPSSDPNYLNISPLKCSSSDDKLDLPNSSQVNSNFSIRDYVFAARSKDIEKNWPFSLKNLQLCFKHGVKDVLPPFDQSLNSTRNKSIKSYANITHVDLEPSEPNDHEMLLEADNDFPLTTTSVCQSEIESVQNIRPSSSSLPIKPNTLLKVSVERIAASRVSHKIDKGNRPPGKKCEVMLKFVGNSDRSSIEDIASNYTTVSESMGSKVCPVCKTFSSSSNTKLNVHIDQCLSSESSPKWTLTRHRIKPRRTRLMVDIYVDAKKCTLEELDIRNGRLPNVIAQETEKKVETPVEPIKSKIHQVESGDVGPVYIDSNGTKLRILSKFNDVDRPLIKVGERLGLRKALKGSKLFSSKKKKRLARMKHHKYLKLAAQSKKKFYSPKTHASQVYSPEERQLRDGEDVHQIPKRTKSSEAETFEQRVCSKQSGTAKKTINQDNQDQLCSRRTRIQKFTNLSEKVLSKKKSKPISDTRFNKKRKSSSVRRRSGESFTELRKDNSSAYGSGMFRSSSSSRNRQFKQSDDSDGPQMVSRKFFTSNQESTPNFLSFSSSRNNILPVTGGLSVRGSRYDVDRQFSAFRNTDSHFNDETDEEVEAYRSEDNEIRFGTEEDTDDDMSLDLGNEHTFTKEKTDISTRNEASASSQSFQACSLDEEENTESFEGSVMSWRKSIDTKLQNVTSPMKTSFDHGEYTFCNHEIGKDVTGQEDCMGVELDTGTGTGKGNSIIDPIPIPGPPGSFLPSPRDMGSDRFPGNSSLTTSCVHSSQDHRDLVDGDSSTSPISAASSILNPTAARSDLKFSGQWFEPNIEAAAGSINGDFLKLHQVSLDKRPLDFRNDDQPCCCQRKGVVLNNQESQLLKRRQATMHIVTPKEWDNISPSTRISHLDNIGTGNIRSENFEPSVPLEGSIDAGVNILPRYDFGSPSPASTPVLRLMGKNLMVINKDDNVGYQPCPTSQIPTQLLKQDGNRNSYYHVVPQASVDSERSMGPDFNASLATSTNFQAQVPAGIFLECQPINGNFRDPIMLHQNYESGRNFLSRPNTTTYDEQQGAGNSENDSYNHNLGPNNAFAQFWPRYPSLRGESESLMGLNIGNHFSTALRPVNNCPPVRWNCTAEGFVIPQQSSFMPPSSSTSQYLGSSPLYYPRSFQ
ncbi:hypothetical protein ACFE04_023800 [Oxalis oulophora]